MVLLGQTSVPRWQILGSWCSGGVDGFRSDPLPWEPITFIFEGLGVQRCCDQKRVGLDIQMITVCYYLVRCGVLDIFWWPRCLISADLPSGKGMTSREQHVWSLSRIIASRCFKCLVTTESSDFSLLKRGGCDQKLEHLEPKKSPFFELRRSSSANPSKPP